MARRRMKAAKKKKESSELKHAPVVENTEKHVVVKGEKKRVK